MQTLGHLALIALTGGAAIYGVGRWPAWSVVLVLFCHGTFFSFLNNGFHELCHNTVFKSKFLNEAALRIFSFLNWQSFIFFRASHALHHKNTLHPPEDLEVVLPIKLTLRGFLSMAIVGPTVFWYVMRFNFQTAFGKVVGEWPNILFPETDPRSRRKLANWARLQLVGHAAIAAVSLAFGYWIVPIVVSLAPFYGAWLHLLCNNTQHVGLKDNVDDFRLCCRTFEVNPFVRFLYWQMNYHTEHHMYAAVPCYNLRRLHKLIEGDLPPTPRGLTATWREIGAILKIQKRDPSYQHEAVLPRTEEG